MFAYAKDLKLIVSLFVLNIPMIGSSADIPSLIEITNVKMVHTLMDDLFNFSKPSIHL